MTDGIRMVPNKDALTTRLTTGGLFVVRLHYAADPSKNPATMAGKQWLINSLEGYPGGMDNPDWQKEMEIAYSAGGGGRVFKQWSDWVRNSNIIFDSELDLTGARLYGSYDHGYRNPCCYLVHAIYPSGLRRTIWEFYEREVPVPMIAKVIKGEAVQLDDGRRFAGNPYAGMEVQKICDPEISRDTQVMSTGPNRSVAYLFTLSGVYFSKGESGNDATVVSWLLGNLWADSMNPGYQISLDCPNLIREIGLLQHVDRKGIMSRGLNEKETYRDKDNHAWDALKYWLKRFRIGVSVPVKARPVADFNYWRDLGKRGGKRVSFPATYVRNT